MNKYIRCTLYALAGSLVVPAILGGLFGPMILADWMGWHPAVGSLIVFMIAGAVAGGIICKERYSEQG
jgi:hypothetical protein